MPAIAERRLSAVEAVTVDKKSFGEHLKALRKKAGLTQEELADATGLGQPQISQWETGMYWPSIVDACAIAKALRVPLDALCLPETKRSKKD